MIIVSSMNLDNDMYVHINRMCNKSDGATIMTSKSDRIRNMIMV
jgi:hypothetical protein